MSGLGVVEALEAAVDRLLLAPRSDAGVRMPAQVVRTGRSLRGAQLPVFTPRLVVDANYAARGSLRRHEHSVADRAVDGHHPVTEWLSIDLLVTGHPEVRFKGATAAPKHSNRPP